MNEGMWFVQFTVDEIRCEKAVDVKVKGNMKYLYALMDDETRFWIARQVADTKYTAILWSLGRGLNPRPAALLKDLRGGRFPVP